MINSKVLKKKHDGSLYTEHGMELWEETEDGIIGFNPIGDTWYKLAENHSFVQMHNTILYFPKDKWYNLLYFYDSTRDFVEKFYINLATPYVREGDRIVYTDYDIDLILRGNQQLVIDDIDEWQARKSLYPPEIVSTIESTMNELIRQILDNTFSELIEIRKKYQSFVINLT